MGTVYQGLPMSMYVNQHRAYVQVEWRAALPTDCADASAGSWLDARVSPKTKYFGIGCSVCFAAKETGKFGQFAIGFNYLQLSNLNNHGRAKCHQRSLAVVKGSSAELDVSAAPSAADFAKVLTAVRSAQGVGGRAEGVGKSKKQRAMRPGFRTAV